jgi:hypothetical protein
MFSGFPVSAGNHAPHGYSILDALHHLPIRVQFPRYKWMEIANIIRFHQHWRE